MRRLFGFTRCVAIAGRMSCDKQRVAVRILFAPVIILRVGTEAAQGVFFEKAMLQSLGEAGFTYLTRGGGWRRGGRRLRWSLRGRSE